jgi:hypothetical protein
MFFKPSVNAHPQASCLFRQAGMRAGLLSCCCKATAFCRCRDMRIGSKTAHYFSWPKQGPLGSQAACMALPRPHLNLAPGAVCPCRLLMPSRPCCHPPLWWCAVASAAQWTQPHWCQVRIDVMPCRCLCVGVAAWPPVCCLLRLLMLRSGQASRMCCITGAV